MKSRPWLCGSGRHVLGMVVWNGEGIPHLDLFRNATLPEFPEEGKVIAQFIGRGPVECDLCDSSRLWDLSVDGIVEIFRHLDAGQVFEFSKRLLEKS